MKKNVIPIPFFNDSHNHKYLCQLLQTYCCRDIVSIILLYQQTYLEVRHNSTHTFFKDENNILLIQYNGESKVIYFFIPRHYAFLFRYNSEWYINDINIPQMWDTVMTPEIDSIPCRCIGCSSFLQLKKEDDTENVLNFESKFSDLYQTNNIITVAPPPKWIHSLKNKHIIFVNYDNNARILVFHSENSYKYIMNMFSVYLQLVKQYN